MEGYVKIANDFVGNKRVGMAAAALLVDFCYHLEKIYPLTEVRPTPRALDAAAPCANCGHPKSAHWHRDCGGAYEFADCGGVFDDLCSCKKYSSIAPPRQ